jgi:hypothetical protein
MPTIAFPSFPSHRRISQYNTTILIEGLNGTSYRFIEIPDSGPCQVYTRSSPSAEVALSKFINWANHFSPAQGPGLDLFIVNEASVSKHKCPLCNSDMIEREGRFGKFFACSAWPKTKCPCTLNKDGKPNKKIQAMIAKKGTKSKTSKDGKDVEFTAVDMLEI